MQPLSPSSNTKLVTSAEGEAASLAANPQAVAMAERVISEVPSATAVGRCGATAAGFGKRGVRGVLATSPVLASSPNPAFEPTAASGVGSIPRWSR